ncbi:MAG: sugar phosphate isomerase/epimerase [Spirochaetia bacterium]|nr:sugar phosphate isomerase/epimerase [Spirochaetia bacterium]
MKLAVSNIAWPAEQLDQHLRILSDEGIDGMELSPSMIWKDPTTIPDAEIVKLKDHVKSYNLLIPSMHSLTYPRPDFEIYGSEYKRNEIKDYIYKLGIMANIMECPIMVFGSGSLRKSKGMDKELCIRILTDFFQSVADRLMELNVMLLIEPLSRQYTDIINTSTDGMDLVKKVNHAFFGLHIDLKSTFDENEDQELLWKSYSQDIRHCHVSNPEMEPPDETFSYHKKVAGSMRKYGYKNFVSIEMKKKKDDTADVLKKSARYLKSVYG